MEDLLLGAFIFILCLAGGAFLFWYFFIAPAEVASDAEEMLKRIKAREEEKRKTNQH